jgi:hypothetical protein
MSEPPADADAAAAARRHAITRWLDGGYLPFSERKGRQNWSADKRCPHGCVAPQILKCANRIVCGRCGAEMVATDVS